jgi:hypothetical protein
MVRQIGISHIFYFLSVDSELIAVTTQYKDAQQYSDIIMLYIDIELRKGVAK